MGQIKLSFEENSRIFFLRLVTHLSDEGLQASLTNLFLGSLMMEIEYDEVASPLTLNVHPTWMVYTMITSSPSTEQTPFSDRLEHVDNDKTFLMS